MGIFKKKETDLEKAIKYITEEYPKAMEQFNSQLDTVSKKTDNLNTEFDKKIAEMDSKIEMLDKRIDSVFDNHEKTNINNHDYWTSSKEVADYATNMSSEEQLMAEETLKNIMQSEGKSR